MSPFRVLSFIGPVLLFSQVLGLNVVQADPHAEKGAKFEERKQKWVVELDEKIKALQEVKTCVSAAKDHEGMKACHEAAAKMRKQHRGEMIDKQIQHLQEEKTKLDQK